MDTSFDAPPVQDEREVAKLYPICDSGFSGRQVGLVGKSPERSPVC
jgi:hypothetical protein